VSVLKHFPTKFEYNLIVKGMDKLFKKWEWKWTANESTREILYFFENDKKMVLELKEKKSNGEKRCEWLMFNKENEKI
jgi:hypothetical protein